MSLEIVFDEDFYLNFSNANTQSEVFSNQEILPRIEAEDIEDEMNQNLYAQNINAVYKPMLIVSIIVILILLLGRVFVLYIC